MNFGTLVLIQSTFYIELPIGEYVKITDDYVVVRNQVALCNLNNHIGEVVSILPVAA